MLDMLIFRGVAIISNHTLNHEQVVLRKAWSFELKFTWKTTFSMVPGRKLGSMVHKKRL